LVVDYYRFFGRIKHFVIYWLLEMVDTGEEKQVIEQIVDRYEREVGMLIPMMQDIQAEYGYLQVEQLKSLGKSLNVPLSRLYAVATFYSSFRLAPKGAHEVTLCMGTVCYLKGAPNISEAICKEFDVQPGGTTRDRLFSFQAVNCVGACALAPVMIVDGKYYDGVTPPSAIEIIQGLSPTDETIDIGNKEGSR
jgi:NADH-quinone oxidoreductase subunit E